MDRWTSLITRHGFLLILRFWLLEKLKLLVESFQIWLLLFFPWINWIFCLNLENGRVAWLKNKNKTFPASCMAIRIRSINSDLNQEIYRAKATRQLITIAIRPALLSTQKRLLTRCSSKEAKYELNTLENALEILIGK